jgi:hypothetical protein
MLGFLECCTYIRIIQLQFEVNVNSKKFEMENRNQKMRKKIKNKELGMVTSGWTNSFPPQSNSLFITRAKRGPLSPPRASAPTGGPAPSVPHMRASVRRMPTGRPHPVSQSRHRAHTFRCSWDPTCHTLCHRAYALHIWLAGGFPPSLMFIFPR